MAMCSPQSKNTSLMTSVIKHVAFSLFFIFTSFWSQAQRYQASVTQKFDLIHTVLEVAPDWSTNHLKGKAILTLKPWFYAQDTLTLDAKGLEIHELAVNGEKRSFEYDLMHLTIPLAKKYTAKDTLNVQIIYTAKPDELSKLPFFKDISYKGLYFINGDENKPSQIWTEGETEYNSCWFPTLDSPNQKHTQEVRIKVKNEFKTLSNGLLTEQIDHQDGTRTDVWKQEKPHAVYLTMIAAGDFAKVIDTTYKDMEVSYYVEPQFESSAMAIFGRTPAMIRYFSEILDTPYPWDKYAQIAVRDYVSGAMENTSATVHGSSIQKLPQQLVNDNDDAVIAHELFHHWFGDLVTAESWANLPLNESFADYSEYLWAAHYYGAEAGMWAQYTGLNDYLLESEEKQVPVIRYQYDSSEDMFDSHSYAKGGRILHMLCQEVGDEAFFASLKLYLQQNAFQNAEIENLRQAFETVTGRDLHWFFDQWFLAAGHPRISAVWESKKTQTAIHISQKIDSLNSRVYRFPLTIEVGTKEGVIRKTAAITSSEQDVWIDTESKPLYILLNPDADLLCEVLDTKKYKKNDAVAIYQQSPSAIARYSALSLLLEGPDSEEATLSLSILNNDQVRNTALDALKDTFWRNRELAALKFMDYDGDDFLKVESALQSIIRTDDAPQVRAAAILAMKNFLNPQNDLLFRNALKDTSYTVRAAALEALLINNPPDADELINNMKNIRDPQLFMPIANYLSNKGNADDYDWFVDRLSKMEGVGLYQNMGIFGSYLVVSDSEVQLKGISFLKNIALNQSLWVARYAATQSLVLLTEHHEALEALKEVVAAEKNERLKALYKQLPLN